MYSTSRITRSRYPMAVVASGAWMIRLASDGVSIPLGRVLAPVRQP
ncbi:hypothetical protein [uncultured Desulfobacter sp.]